MLDVHFVRVAADGDVAVLYRADADHNAVVVAEVVVEGMALEEGRGGLDVRRSNQWEGSRVARGLQKRQLLQQVGSYSCQ